MQKWESHWEQSIFIHSISKHPFIEQRNCLNFPSSDLVTLNTCFSFGLHRWSNRWSPQYKLRHNLHRKGIKSKYSNVIDINMNSLTYFLTWRTVNSKIRKFSHLLCLSSKLLFLVRKKQRSNLSFRVFLTKIAFCVWSWFEALLSSSSLSVPVYFNRY